MDRQELFCHECRNYVQFNIPAENGNLVVECPNCGHEHLRVVKNGVITEDRWGSRNNNNPTMYASGTAYTTSSYITVSATSSTSSYFIQDSWMNTGTVSMT